MGSLGDLSKQNQFQNHLFWTLDQQNSVIVIATVSTVVIESTQQNLLFSSDLFFQFLWLKFSLLKRLPTQAVPENIRTFCGDS